jgi:5-formyltetrahydrofolate cyclo-ligase|tara:strand:+ start:14926 stop:15504 length:579 start_codon:yes stop_codon:yes gene_type:complete
MIKNKKFYREKYQALRMKLLKEEIYDLSDKIVSILKTIPVWEKNTYHLFISSKQKNEVETKKILSYLYDLGKVVVTSKMLPDKKLIHLRVNQSTRFIQNDYNILEPDSSEEILPTDLDVVIIPLLCFDKNGNRVGYGGGYYDKFLSKTENAVMKIGLSFFEPVDQIEGITKLDVPLDICVTSEKVYDFRKMI